MASILAFFARALGDLARLFREILSLLIDGTALKPFFAIVAKIEAQVERVASVFDKKPCSATGGTA